MWIYFKNNLICDDMMTRPWNARSTNATKCQLPDYHGTCPNASQGVTTLRKVYPSTTASTTTATSSLSGRCLSSMSLSVWTSKKSLSRLRLRSSWDWIGPGLHLMRLEKRWRASTQICLKKWRARLQRHHQRHLIAITRLYRTKFQLKLLKSGKIRLRKITELTKTHQKLRGSLIRSRVS